ncbi:MAG: ADP-ribosylglycohydrolase family protein [Cyanophyceae cyanobacterium]
MAEATIAGADPGPVAAALFGAAIADALGVPVEFSSRGARQRDPVTDFRGYGTWNQPPGTWSDDSSLLFCLAESLAAQGPTGFDLAAIARNLARWRTEAHWAARGEVFDIGGTTEVALGRVAAGISPERSGETSDRSNGNGSLMRILPMVFVARHWERAVWGDRVRQVSAITHAHPRSQLACELYIAVALRLLAGEDRDRARLDAMAELGDRLATPGDELTQNLADQWPHFQRLNDPHLKDLAETDIISGGYCIHTLEAALWCLARSGDYCETVLMAVNLGGDTDTTACVAGGLAGLAFGDRAIPPAWKAAIARHDDIAQLAHQLEAATAIGHP